MRKIEYRVVTGNKGFKDFERQISDALNDGWKPIGGLAFNAGFAHQAIAKTVEAEEESKVKEIQHQQKASLKALTANEAMKRIDDLT